MEVSIKVGKVNSNIKINSIDNNDLNINEYLNSSNYVANNSSINYNNEVEDYVFNDVVGDVTYSPYSNNSLLEYSENLLEILQDDINSHLRENIFYRLEDNANNGDWFSSMITGMFPFIHDFADDTCEFYINNNMRVSVVGEHIEIFDASTGRRFYYEDGFCTEVHFQNGVVGSFSYDENGNYTGISYSYSGNPLSIYDDYNSSSYQFGGDQMHFRDYREILLQDQRILDLMHRSFPNDSLEDYELYFCALCSHGCAYVAFINLIFENYQGREDEFLDTFGFPMYTVDDYGIVDYNYEYLVLELFNYVWADQGYSIQELYGNVNSDATDLALDGTEDDAIVSGPNIGYTDYYNNPVRSSFTTFNQWLYQTYGIQLERNSYYRNDWGATYEPLTPEWYERLRELRLDYGDPNTPLYGPATNESIYDFIQDRFNEDRLIIICAVDFTMEDVGYGFDHSSVGSHAMVVTDVVDDGIIVSSWGRQCFISISEFEHIYNMQIFNFYN